MKKNLQGSEDTLRSKIDGACRYQKNGRWVSKGSEKINQYVGTTVPSTFPLLLGFWRYWRCTPPKFNGWNIKITQLKRKIIGTKPPYLGSMLIFGGVYKNTVDGSEIPKQPPGMYKTCRIMGKNNQPQVVQDFWTIISMNWFWKLKLT